MGAKSLGLGFHRGDESVELDLWGEMLPRDALQMQFGAGHIFPGQQCAKAGMMDIIG